MWESLAPHHKQPQGILPLCQGSGRTSPSPSFPLLSALQTGTDTVPIAIERGGQQAIPLLKFVIGMG